MKLDKFLPALLLLTSGLVISAQSMAMGSEQATQEVCERFRMEARHYPNQCCEGERIPLLRKALECYEKVPRHNILKIIRQEYEWIEQGANEVIDELSEGENDIDGFERIVARAKAVCHCDYEEEYSHNKLMLKLNAMRLYKANFDARKNIIPPGEILVRVPEKHAHYFHACQMSWISAETKGEAYGKAITGNVGCKSNEKGEISFGKDYSDLIRNVLAKGDTILLTDNIGTISYMTYKTCDSKPCLVSALYQWD